MMSHYRRKVLEEEMMSPYWRKVKRQEGRKLEEEMMSPYWRKVKRQEGRKLEEMMSHYTMKVKG